MAHGRYWHTMTKAQQEACGMFIGIEPDGYTHS